MKSTEQIVTAIRAVNDDSGRFCRHEEEALKWVLDLEYEHITPDHHHDISIDATEEEIREYIDQLEEQRTKYYAAGNPTTADGLAYAISALEWVMDENDAYDHVLP